MLLKQKTEYSRYYGDFRGVDFSNDHTLVADGRFPYAVNMYKDYASGLGQGIETIPGFRRRFTAPNGGRIYGIHTVKIGGTRKVLVHAGTALYDWASYGEDESVSAQKSTALFEEMNAHDSVSFIFNNRLYLIDGKNYLVYDGNAVSSVKDDAYVPTTYINIIPAGENADIGTEYEQRNMLSPYFKHTFIATTYTDPEGNEIEATEFYMNEPFKEIREVKVYGEIVERLPDEPKPDIMYYTADPALGKITFTIAPKRPEETIMDGEGETAVYYPEMYAGVEIMAYRPMCSAEDVKDVRITRADESVATLSAYKGDGKKDSVTLISSATIATVFDNRIFLSGFEGKPNLIFFCGRDSTGFADPSYIGVLNYMEDGVGTTPITAMLPVANTLLVLKNDTEQDGSVYYHTPSETGIDILPKIYPSEAGLAGTGCVGAACNFLDDPVFVSRLGLEAIGQLSVRYERAREHRSSMVDAKLVNLSGLSEAKLAEWNGYLVLLVSGEDTVSGEDAAGVRRYGNIFLADSRQVFTGTTGTVEYEWYYLEDIGVFDGQRDRYTFITDWPARFTRSIATESGEERIERIPLLSDVEVKLITEVYPNIPSLEVEKRAVSHGEIELTIGQDENGNDIKEIYSFSYCKYEGDDTCVFLCDTEEEKIYGDFCPAVTLRTINEETGENLFFGTTNGIVCSFNFDQRDDDGFINPRHYTFDGRSIYCGCALKMDNCGIPHMTKSTIKRSTVIKVKSFASTAAKVRVRTNKNPYHEISRINSSRFSFDQMDFSDFSFITSEETLFSIREKEKKWVEKQYYVYSDEYKKPFALFYVAHKYFVAGKYKSD